MSEPPVDARDIDLDAFEDLVRRAQEGGLGEEDLAALPEPMRRALAPDLELARRFAPGEAPPFRPAAASGGGEIFGPYRLISPLGSGGQGDVHLARDTRLDRLVALKIFRGALWSGLEGLERFKREARIGARIDHPGVCTVLEAGEADGRQYIAMPWIRGETLARWIERRPGEPSRKEVTALVSLMESAARALHCAHLQGVVHRDLKPGNIMVAEGNRAVLLDFGLSRMTGAEAGLSRHGAVLGTPAYMAPEQVEPSLGLVDARSDVHALGAVLYEACTGRRPFEAPTREALYRAILRSPPPGPRALNPAIPRGLETVILTALSKEPDRRYATAEDLACDLRRVIDGMPVTARRAGPLLRVALWARRNRPLAAALFLLFVTLAGGLFATLRMLRDVERNNEELRIRAELSDARDWLRSEPGRALGVARAAARRLPPAHRPEAASLALLALLEGAELAGARRVASFPSSPVPLGDGVGYAWIDSDVAVCKAGGLPVPRRAPRFPGIGEDGISHTRLHAFGDPPVLVVTVARVMGVSPDAEADGVAGIYLADAFDGPWRRAEDSRGFEVLAAGGRPGRILGIRGSRELALWRGAARERFPLEPPGPAGGAPLAAFSGGGRLFVLYGDRGLLYDFEAPRDSGAAQPIAVPLPEGGLPLAAALDDSGRTAWILGEGLVLSIVDLDTLSTRSSELRPLLEDESGGRGPRRTTLFSAALHPDSGLVALGWWGVIDLVDASVAHAPVHLASLRGHTRQVQGLRFSSTGRHLASAAFDYDPCCRLWATDPVAKRSRLAPGWGDSMRILLSVRDGGSWMVLGSGGGDVQLWTEGRRWSHRALASHAGQVRVAHWAAPVRLLATGCSEGAVQIQHIEGGRHPVARFDLHRGPVSCLAGSMDGRWLATGGLDGRIFLVDLLAGAGGQPRALLDGPGDWVQAVFFIEQGGGVRDCAPAVLAASACGRIRTLSPAGQGVLREAAGSVRFLNRAILDRSGGRLLATHSYSDFTQAAISPAPPHLAFAEHLGARTHGPLLRGPGDSILSLGRNLLLAKPEQDGRRMRFHSIEFNGLAPMRGAVCESGRRALIEFREPSGFGTAVTALEFAAGGPAVRWTLRPDVPVLDLAISRDGAEGLLVTRSGEAWTLPWSPLDGVHAEAR